MAYFPFFIDIKNLRGLVVGGGSVAERKVKGLLEFDANLTVVAEKVSPTLAALAKSGRIVLVTRAFSAVDIEDVFYVVAATDSVEVNKGISDIARQKNVLVNAVDSIDDCDFIFSAILKRGDCTVAVSTAGACPSAAQAVRDRIGECLPDKIGERLAVLKEKRDALIKDEKQNRDGTKDERQGSGGLTVGEECGKQKRDDLTVGEERERQDLAQELKKAVEELFL
ncbi:MAG: bifunctional precorrin-2 dehydrogenase/sirohydrochlorin ferrochelatase [Clostridiales bacterium]|nr:bifunctional precorrin-2 dehydrogenase/sirohydrochlorin ferrochelatase [Clostridiales bacterium]